MKKILIMGLMMFSIFLVAGCDGDYGYSFHYSVIGGNGEITLENDSLVRGIDACSESLRCELGCPDNSFLVSRLGGKNGSHRLIFIAVPNEGYQVREWLFNGEIVEGNKSNTFEAVVSSNQGYNGVIAVRFEAI